MMAQASLYLLGAALLLTLLGAMGMRVGSSRRVIPQRPISMTMTMKAITTPASIPSLGDMGSRASMNMQSLNSNGYPSTAPRRLRRDMCMMAAQGGGSSKGGGATKLDRKTTVDTETKSTYREEIEKDWRLILHDDSVHTIQEVVEMVSSLCPLCPPPRAYEVTMLVHMEGSATVAVSNKKIVEEYTKSLQMAGLTVSMAPDDEFEDSEGEEGDE